MGYFSEQTRRRIAALLLVVGTTVVVLAIGDVGPFDDPPTEEERAQYAVERFFAAGSEEDFKTFCGVLTRPARNLIEQRGAALAAQKGLEGCDEILDALIGDQLGGSELDVTDVNVSGTRARVETELKLEGDHGREPHTVLLEQVDGEWEIADPGFD